MTTNSYGNSKSRAATLLDFGVVGELGPAEDLELTCEKRFWPRAIEPIKTITKTQYYQTLVFRTKQERDKVATVYRAWLSRQRGLS